MEFNNNPSNSDSNITQVKGFREDPLDTILLSEEAVTNTGFKEGYEKGDQECQATAFNTAIKTSFPLEVYKTVLAEFLAEDLRAITTVRNISVKEADLLTTYHNKLKVIDSKSQLLVLANQLVACEFCCLTKDSFTFKHIQEELRKY